MQTLNMRAAIIKEFSLLLRFSADTLLESLQVVSGTHFEGNLGNMWWENCCCFKDLDVVLCIYAVSFPIHFIVLNKLRL